MFDWKSFRMRSFLFVNRSLASQILEIVQINYFLLLLKKKPLANRTVLWNFSGPHRDCSDCGLFNIRGSHLPEAHTRSSDQHQNSSRRSVIRSRKGVWIQIIGDEMSEGSVDIIVSAIMPPLCRYEFMPLSIVPSFSANTQASYHSHQCPAATSVTVSWLSKEKVWAAIKQQNQSFLLGCSRGSVNEFSWKRKCPWCCCAFVSTDCKGKHNCIPCPRF
jgi:hypothetical protein